jgi:hypothetical protein
LNTIAPCSAPSPNGAATTSSLSNHGSKDAPVSTGPLCATPGAPKTSPPTPTSPSTGNH